MALVAVVPNFALVETPFREQTGGVSLSISLFLLNVYVRVCVTMCMHHCV